MSNKLNSILAAATGLTFATAVAATMFAPARLYGFGPKVHNDSSLNANLGVLAQIVAWQNSPNADTYQLAQNLPDRGKTFTQVALASIPNINQ